jgi:hypothetical protein
MATSGRDDANVIGRLLMSVYEVHERIIASGGGGLKGIRDAGLLHAAVARPFATFGMLELYRQTSIRPPLYSMRGLRVIPAWMALSILPLLRRCIFYMNVVIHTHVHSARTASFALA